MAAVHLPAEILREIFLRCIASEMSPAEERVETDAEPTDGQRWPDVFALHKGPWVFTRVSSQWRAVATSFPDIWNHFLLGTYHLGRAGQTQILQTWLTYTGNSRISFFMRTGDICDHPQNAQLFTTLLAHSDRWEKIEVVNSTSEFWNMLRNHTHPTPVHFPTLVSVTLLSEGNQIPFVDEDEVTGPQKQRYNAFATAPNLQSLRIRDFFEGLIPTNPGDPICIPWHQLTSYEGSGHLDGTDCHIPVLQRSPNLEWCRIEVLSENEESEHQLGAAVTLSNLRTFEVWSSVVEAVRPLGVVAQLSNLRLPNLENLSVVSKAGIFSADSLVTPYAPFTNIITNSNPQRLRKLEISDSFVMTEDVKLLALLHSANQTITHLCLYLAHPGSANSSSSLLRDVLLPHLHHPIGAPAANVLLPNLAILELKYTTVQDVTHGLVQTLVGVVNSRMGLPTRIQEVYLTLTGHSARSEKDYTLEVDRETILRDMGWDMFDFRPKLAAVEALQAHGVDVVLRRLYMSRPFRLFPRGCSPDPSEFENM